MKALFGAKIAASDGAIGHVLDGYFDDKNWALRYLVVETGSWFTGREVLLSPRSFQSFDDTAGALTVKLTRKQVQESPPMDSHRPVSQQYEYIYNNYYGWPSYWEGGALWGLSAMPEAAPATPPQLHHGHQQRDDVHLRSMKAIIGYQLQAINGVIGEVTGYLVDNQTWAIKDILIETGHWYAGKIIHLAPAQIERISELDNTLSVQNTLEEIRHTAVHASISPELVAT